MDAFFFVLLDVALRLLRHGEQMLRGRERGNADSVPLTWTPPIKRPQEGQLPL